MTNKKFPATEAQRASGDWNPFWDLLEEMDRDYREAFLAFRSVPIKQGPITAEDKGIHFHRYQRGNNASLGAGSVATYPQRPPRGCDTGRDS